MFVSTKTTFISIIFMEINDRLNQLLAYKQLTSRSFAMKLGVSSQRMGNYLKNRAPDYDVLSRIIETFVDISPDWLLTGRGEMLRNEEENICQTKSAKNVVKEKDHNFDHVFDHKRKVQKTWSINLNNNDAALGLINQYTPSEDTGIVVPIVDIAAAAGAGAFNSDYYTQRDTLRFPSHMIQRGVHNCIRIKGQSMSPTLQDGGYVITRLLDRSEWETIKDNYIYVITNREGETFLKRVKNRLKEGGFLVCTSDNPEKATYRDFNVMEDEIHNVWMVEWYLSSTLPNIHETYYLRLQNLEDDVDQLKSTMTSILKKLS